jgi:HK97 family phage major capsid protein
MSDKTDARVVHEPRIYSARSPHSYFRDVAALATGDARTRLAARRRLNQYEGEVVAEIDRDSAEGRRAMRTIREATRQDDVSAHEQSVRDLLHAAETRTADSTATNSFGAFVTPIYVNEHWQPFSGQNRVFTDQTMILPLPDYGMSVHVPSFQSAASAGTVTENAATATAIPTGADLTLPINPVAGQVLISQQLSDRSGGAYDIVLGKQLNEQLDESINRYVLQQAIQSAIVIPASAAATFIEAFYGDVATGRSKITDTAGVTSRATHVFTTADFHSYVTRILDNQQRPIVTPTFAPGAPIIRDDESDRWWGFTGVVLPGALLWFADTLIPPSGANTRVVVSNPSTILTWEGTPTLSVFDQTQGNQLSTVVSLSSYVACLQRSPAATAVVTGPNYSSALD